MIEAFNISICASRKCKSVCVCVQSDDINALSDDFVTVWHTCDLFPVLSLRVWCAH